MTNTQEKNQGAMRDKNLGVTPQSEDFSAWYQDVAAKAQLADRGPVKGTMVIRPYGYRMWELLQSQLDHMFKETGHENAYFPLFIPMSYIEREAEHVDGFAPELAVVTHAGGKELEEPFCVRPTSETIIGEMMSKWISSHRDLPLLLNQWANVVRWELRPRLFLRTTEFLWQEGHTAHIDEEDAMKETLQMLEVYRTFAYDIAAIPVFVGEKTPGERFAGAVATYTIEGIMRDRKALQSGTSHYLGTNFAKAFDIKYSDKNEQQSLCHTTSWGMSTRMLGAVIMAHGDDAGLVLPPRLAPYQAVIIPIGKGDGLDAVIKAAEDMAAELKKVGVRTYIDDRDLRPGFKYNDWELKGVPIRIEIGARDIEGGSVPVAQRLGLEGKDSVAIADIATDIPARLERYHNFLLERAKTFRDEVTTLVDTWDDFAARVTDGVAVAWHCGRPECEDEIKAETVATPRCITDDWEAGTGECVKCGQPSAYGKRVIFARAY